MILKTTSDSEAEAHIEAGGQCKTIVIKGVEYHCCLDTEGEIINPMLKTMARLTGQ